MADTLGNQSVFSVFLSLSSFLPRWRLQELGPACLAFIYWRDICDVGPSITGRRRWNHHFALSHSILATSLDHTTSERKGRQVLREKRRPSKASLITAEKMREKRDKWGQSGTEMIPHLGRKMRRRCESPVVCAVRQTSRSPAVSQCTCKDPSEPNQG